MSIQSNINQITSLAGLLLSQSPAIKTMTEERIKGRSLQSGQESAYKTLKDIAGNVKRVEAGEKEYSDTEVKDILSRASEESKKIYDAKVTAQSGAYSKYINPDYVKQSEIASLNKEIERLPEIVKKAKMKAESAKTAKTMEKEASKNFVKTVMEGVYSPLTDPRKGDH